MLFLKNNNDNRIFYLNAFSVSLSPESDGFEDLPLMERVSRLYKRFDDLFLSVQCCV